MPQITWILVNCNSEKEAKRIGNEILKKRLISCFEIIPRPYAAYFWPPKSGKIEEAKGATLISETLIENSDIIDKIIRKLHSDKLPFIGLIKVGVYQDYFNWLKDEIKVERRKFKI